MHKGRLAHHARRRGNTPGDAHADLVQFAIGSLQDFRRRLLTFDKLSLEAFKARHKRLNRILTGGSVGDVAAFEFVWIDIADERAQSVQMLAPCDSLIVLFDKWNRHRNP